MVAALCVLLSTSAVDLVRPLLLEHLNVNVPDRELAQRFYVEALGGRLNPASTCERLLHVNVGLSQFHLPLQVSVRGREPVTVAQRWGGQVELLTSEPLAAVAERVRALGFEAHLVPSAEDEHLLAQGPWASSCVLRRAPVGLASAIATQRGHAGGTGTLLALTRATVRCRPGHAARIARFYRQTLGLLVEEGDAAESGPPSCSPSETGSAELRRATVRFESSAPGLVPQELSFVEAADAPPANEYDTDEAAAVHIALYMPSSTAFATAFKRVEAAGLLYVNPRFEGGPVEYGSARSLDEALATGQFRVKDLVDPEAGQGGDPADALGIVLEHEIRYPAHRAFPLLLGDK